MSNETIFSDDHRFDVVAIAHKNVQRIWDVKGKRLCHPGLDTVDDWTKIFSTVGELYLSFVVLACLLESCSFLELSLVFQYFENLVIKKECDTNMTLFENRIHALSSYFETACIAGPWSADTVFDYQLSMYSIENIYDCTQS